MEGRWSASSEPPRALASGENVDLAWLRSHNRMDIPVGENETVDIAARFDDDKVCYGWSNENYFIEPPWRNRRWEQPEGRYIVRVEIRTTGLKFIQYFRLCNEGPLDSFRLEPSKPEDKKKIQRMRTTSSRQVTTF